MLTMPTTKAEAIYHDIKKSIIDGTLMPGTHLIIKQLADQYGVSDIPVREALKNLNAEGLIETIPHTGSRVTGFSLKNIEDMLQMRECLEPYASKLAARYIEEEAICEMEEIHEELKRAFAAEDEIAYRENNRKFHALMVKACSNDMMTKTILTLIESEKRMRLVFRLFPEILDISNQEHGLMVEYLKARNAKALGEVVYIHKKRAFDKMRDFLKKQGTMNSI